MDRVALTIYPGATASAIRLIALLGLCAAYLQGGLVNSSISGGAVTEAQRFGLPFARAIAGATTLPSLSTLRSY